MESTEQLRPEELVGLVARSAEGTAAKGMPIKGHEDLWVEIQANTFRNWVNEHLKHAVDAANGPVIDLVEDFRDGTRLCALVEVLTKRRLPRWNPRPANQHHHLENVSTALQAIEADGVKLVNIGNVDIVNGNLKLILGLIWSLIVRYQIGKSKFPPRKLMLAWLKTVLPECRVNNFTTDWNSGVYLSALLDYCQPGLFPHWRRLDPNDSVYNCRKAMEISKREFDIPMVLEPEYLASPYLDELSGMTYLSYFMKEGSPGFHATLRWVNSQLSHPVQNFTTDWNDGRTLCSIVRNLGGPAPVYDKIDTDPSAWEHNIQMGIDGGKKLGVEPILKAKDMADQNVEHLGVMAYAANFQWVKPRPQASKQIVVHIDSTSARVQQPAHFKLEILTKEVNTREVRGEVINPSGRIECRLTWNGIHGKGTFIPTEVGMHKLMVYNDGELVDGCPYYFRVLPPLTKIKSPGMDPCAIGSIVEVLVNSYGTSHDGIDVTAWSPTGRSLSCPVKENDGVHTATFQPDETGEWSIAITHKGNHIQGGPFTCFVFDPNGVKLLDTEGALPRQPFSFTVDATGTGGLGDVIIDLVHDKQSVPFRVENLGHMQYQVSFVPSESGKYRVYVYFNGSDVRGSPFSIRVGTQKGSKRSKESSLERSKLSSLERRMNGLNVSVGTDRSSPVQQKTYSSPTYKLPSPTQRVREYSPVQQTTSTYKTSNNYSLENSSSTYHTSTSFNHTRSPNHSPVSRNLHSPSMVKDTKEIYSTTTYNHSRSPTVQSPSFMKESKDVYTSNTISRSRSPNPSPTVHDPRYSPVIKESREIYSSGSLKRSRSPNRSPMTYRSATQSPINRSFSPRNNDRDNGYNRKDSIDNGTVDTSSNVRVSSMVGGTSRRDSWDAIEKTKSLLSYGSLESLANLTNNSATAENTNNPNYFNNNYKNTQGYNSKNILHTHNSSSNFMSTQKLSTSEYNISQKYNNESHNTRTQTHGILKNKNNNYYKSADTTDGITERYINSGISTSSSTQARDYELASGSALETLPIHRPATFIIDQSIDPDKVTVSVSGPNGKIIPVQKSTLRGLTYTITAEEVGEHIIQILVNGQHIQGSPFRSQAYNARGIQIGNIPNGIVNQPVEFEIDGSNAGSGNLEILVNGGHVTSFVRALGSQRFLASFVPHEAVVHLVEMTFNGEVVPGSPWRVGIMPAPKMSVIGDSIRLVPAGSPALFELSALGFNSNEIDVQIITPSKRHVPAKIDEESGRPGEFRVEFTPIEVGSHLVEVTIAGQKLPAGPLVAKVYNSSLIQVTDVPSAVVGHACQFRVDASAAGEGQLEISINEGEVPNHVQVVGGGRCLVSFTPEIAKSHYIDIKFNGEAVKGCPFICNVSDTSRVTLSLNHLELIPVDQPASFHMGVDGSGSAELAVSVRGPNSELPVKVTGDIKSGFTAEFIPRDVGVHSISVEYNGHPVNGTPFLAKAFNADKVLIGPVARGSVGQPTHFTVDASQAGEGNLEITISARSQNIPTQVTPQGNARFSVSFVPFEACEHIINIAFNKRTVPGCPIVTRVGGDSHVTVSGQALSSAGLGRQSYLTVSNVAGSLEDLEVNVEGPNGQAVPAQVTDNKDTTCSVAFTPRVVGEHRISVSHRNVPVIGSPFSCKVYDVTAIKVKDSKHGVIGMPVTFLVETSQAGPGNLEVTVNGGRVPTSAQAQGPHTYAISFTPREPIVHTVDLRFNGEDVPGSPFSCQVSDTAKVIITEGLEKVSVNRLTTFTIEADSSLGTPTVEVLSPTRESLPIHVKQSGHGCYTAGFTPKDVGDHSVEVKINGLHVEGSPFLVKAYNADKVKVTDINSGVVGKPVFFSINASQAGAGNLEIIVAVNGKNVPNYVQSEGNAKFRVNFKPQEAAVHSLSVRFNGEPVPGSPFSCKVVGAGQAIITGHNLKMGAVKQLISFIIDPQAPSTNCDVIVTPPSNISLPITIEPIDGKYNISFVPMEVGRHNISILVDNEHVKGSPFACNVYDVTKVHVSGLSEALLGQATTFTVDAAEAGEGTLELVVSTDNNTVKAEVVACARGLYDVTFVPQTTSTHYVNISFNDDNVPGSPFKCPVISTMLDGPSMIRVGNTAYMDLEMPGLEGPVSAEVTGPDGIIIPCTLTKLSSNLYRVEIRTRQVGTYSVIFSDGHKIISSQTLQAFDPGKVTIKEVSDVVCHRPGTILVVAPKEAGPGKLTVNVRAAGADVDSVVREGENGQYDIMFHPTRAAPHKIHIKYNEVHILGSPLDVTVRGPTGGREVTATGLGLYQSCVGKVTSFTIETLGSPGKEFDVVISGPQGNAVPVRCYQHRDGNLLAEFTTNTVGTYKIDVLQGTKPVLGSPFFCQAFDISKVKLQELGPMIVSVHDHIAFKIIKTDAGMADLDVVATSPLGQELPLQVTPLNDGAEMVEFSPSVPGTYMINITYGGCPIPDSPLICTVDAAGQARAKGEGLLSGHADKTAHFIVTGTRSPPAVQVDGPDSVSKAIIEAGANPGTWNVSYVPTEVGVFDIRVVSAGQQLPGSPWHPKIIDTRNLRVIGGWPAVCDDVGRLKLHPSNKISFDTAEAGPGELTGKIGEHMLSFEMTSNNRLKLIPPELNGGEHRLEILFNGIPFPGAPKLAIVQDIEPPIQDTSRVLLRGRGLTSAKCGEEVSFTIDGSQAGTGTPKVQLFSPTSELNVMLQHLGDSVYRASYIPLTPDPLLMTVSWNGRQLKGCPLQINVTSAADASRVICSGDGLKHGIVGQEIRSFIDTRRAGPGELTAHCVGPHKVAYCELYDHGDATFTLNVKPQEAGRHALTIKYAGEHVPGSPFTLRVSGAPDASKVRVYGPGIEHGVLATFQSRFICDTRGAGAGQLTVRVRGPKGAFRVEMQRETQKDRIILCRYDPTEPGDYRVEVRWAGVLVPGSPFPVKIVDTQDELLMLTQSGDNYSTGHHTIASWRGSQAIL
ncbi:filamin-A isoform X1 [Bombus vosnesenskii]|uniref:Filamin-A isoform X1 n=4 Tax=Pyrobombus TaxID=144703 RepID=A0A6J3KFJ5_9HYME|nr:filamin-A isoform X1 [Bombus impatiens]XP_024226884.1 filamin-A isoform X1 [Bombus impatiens]XP_033179574.1 filamin-A isoform X1 [Bombus impatiens]XP_033351947.1 filamin-A isoform X1 [Bombus vosnesenskii]XP_033351948.1 filamin-A isoform X1 [Bombus vosnesenskii]